MLLVSLISCGSTSEKKEKRLPVSVPNVNKPILKEVTMKQVINNQKQQEAIVTITKNEKYELIPISASTFEYSSFKPIINKLIITPEQDRYNEGEEVATNYTGDISEEDASYK